MAAIVRRREAPNTNSITIISIDSSRLDPPLWHIQPQAMPGWIITTTVRYTSVWQTHNTEIRLFKISSFSILSSSSFILQKLKCVFTSIIQLQSSHVHQQHERAEQSPAILQHSRSNFQQHFQSIHIHHSKSASLYRLRSASLHYFCTTCSEQTEPTFHTHRISSRYS